LLFTASVKEEIE